MAKASVGKAPWSEGYEGNPFRRFTVKQQRSAGMRNVGKGWVSQDAWDKMPKHPPMVEHILPSGKKVKVVAGDYDSYIGFQRPDQNKTVAMLAEISDAFNWDDSERLASGKKPLGVKHVLGCGHISWIEYNPMRQIMMVQFASDDAIVIYFQVPSNVWAILEHWAINKAQRYDGKYLLGVQFWDYIRIRGQLTGSRYRYVYTQEGMQLTGAMSTDGGPVVSVNEATANKPISSAKMNRSTMEAFLKSQGIKPAKTDAALKEQIAKIMKDV